MIRTNSQLDSPLRLIYISPRCPSTSLVFEQAEIEALRSSGAEVFLYSCRNTKNSPADLVHARSAPVAGSAHYFSVINFFCGLAVAACGDRPALWRITRRTIGTWKHSPRRIGKNTAAWALALSCYFQVRNQQWSKVHADFGQGSATVAWHLADLLGKPFSFKVHAFDIFSSDSRECDAREFFSEKCKAADRIYAAHRYGRQYLLKHAAPELAQKIEIQRVFSFAPLHPPPPYAPGDGPPQIIALGRLEAKKGFHVLITALELLRGRGVDFECRIYGEGPERMTLSRLIVSKELARQIKLCGSYRNEQLAEILVSAAAVVVPSVEAGAGVSDGMPTVITEAMQYGRPVVASALAAIPEVVIDKLSGILVRPGNAGELADALALLLTDRDLARELAERSRRQICEAGRLRAA